MNDNRIIRDAALLEAVHNSLSYYGEDAALEAVITHTVARLPLEVRDFVADRCVFISVGQSTLGIVLPGRIATHHVERRTRNRWLIVLAETLPVGDEHGVVAHEIAHAYLRHDRLSLDATTKMEREAAELVRAWGFDGLGADVQHCLGTIG